MSKRMLIVACLMAFAAGWFVSGAVEKPKDRPFLKAIVKVAKTFLWVAAFAEQPPEEHADAKSVMVGEDGYVQVNHARGW